MIKECLKCSKKFNTYPSRIMVGRGKYCCKKCYDISTIGKILSSETREKLRLAGLGIKNHFFGKNHTEESKLKMVEGNKGKHLSPRTQFKKGIKPWNVGIHFTEISGENHPNWKGGITSENHRLRDCLEAKLWRDAVFARDGYVCQKTGQVGGELECHHIFNFADYPELRFAIDNGITLSKKAHKLFHHKYGVKNNTREQLDEYLSIGDN